MKKITHIILLFFGLVFLLGSEELKAQVKQSFQPRFSEAVNGNVTLIANNVLSRHESNNYNGNDGNHDFTNNVFVDIDNDNTTFNSSNANFVNPEPSISCLSIKKAYLYWAAADLEEDDPDDEPDWDYNKVKLQLPGSSTYQTITADQVIFRGRDEPGHFVNDPYICFKDITNDVKGLSSPYGTYQIANVRAKEGELESHGGGNTGTSGGWQIVFVYESPTMPAKNISLFDGYANVTSSINEFEIGFSGFQTVPSGNVNVDVVIGALEGDRDLSGDKLQIRNVSNNWVDVSYSLRSANNFFNSRIGKDGTDFTNRNPASTNTLGFDADVFPLNNSGNSIIDNDQTSATIRLTSNQETYGLFLIGLSVDVWKPDLAPLILTSSPTTGSSVNVGDTVDFSVDVENNGNDDVRNLSIEVDIPQEVELTQPITGLPSGVTYTYNSGTRKLTFNAVNGITDVGDAAYTLNYQVVVKGQCYFLENTCSDKFQMQMTANYIGEENSNSQSTVSSNSVDSCGIGDELPNTININQPSEASWTTAANFLDRTVSCDDSAALQAAQQLIPELNCNLATVKTSGSFVPSVNCSTNGTYTNTWTFTDACGRVSGTFTQTITVEDNTAPDFTVPANTTIYAAADCTYDASVGVTGDVTDESDNCDTSLEATFSDSVAAGSCEGEQVITRTWSLTDDCGNTTSKVQTITVEDNTAPDFTVPANTTIYAAADCTYDASVGVTGDVTDESDNCDTSLEATFSDSVAAGSCEGEQVITRTWSLTDDCGNTTSKVQTITVEDNTAPDFTVPANTTIYAAADCTYDASVGVTGDVTDESDNCDTSLEATFSDSVAAGSCEGEQVITRTWSLTDDCGNTTSKVQTITVEDNTAPDFTVPANTTIYAAADCTYDASVGVTGDVTDESDNCDTSLEATFSDSVAAGSCEGEQVITRTWSLTDDCGNTTSKVQTITVEDNTAPDFTVPANTTIYAAADCTYDASVGVTGDVTDESDNCDTSLEATFSDSVAAGSCEGEQVITRTWSLTDDCGNTTSKVQTITVEDNTAPDFTVPANTTIYAAADCTYDASVGVTGDVTDESDNCDTSLEATFSDSVAAGSCEGEQVITRTWSLTDDCGNTTSKVQTITVEDNTAPDFTVPANTTIYAAADCTYDASVGVTGDVTDESDNCDTSLEATFSDSVAAGSCEGEQVITRTWSLTDDCGNTTSKVQTITVEDNTAPDFTVPANTTIYAAADCTYDASVGVTGDVTDESDNCDTSLEATFSDSVAAGSCEGEQVITRTWSLTDDCGNTTSKVQTITVEDNTAPDFTVPANTTIYAAVDCTYDASVGVTGDVTDESDNCDTSLEATFSDSVAAGSCEGEQVITRTWSLTDDCGNTTSKVQTITVEDNTAPDFTVPANTTIYAAADCTYDASVGVTGDVTDESDNCDTSLEATFSDSVAAGSCEGEQVITRTWSLTDDCGNTTSKVQTITVEDNTAPDFTVPANTTIYAAADCTYDASVGVTGDVTDESDNCDTSLEATFSDSVAAGSCEGEQVITRTWSLTDDCGNTTSKVQTITVEDNTAPDFTVPANTTIYAAVDCTYDASVGVTGDVTDESDNCDTSLEATFSDSVAAGSCEGEQVITRTWSLTDDCGNTTSKVQTITVEDNTAPDFTVPANTTIYAAADCTYDASVGVTGDVTDESDNCDTSLEATFSDSVAAGSCEGEQVITRTWSLTDDCGNTTSKVQTITVEDNTAPDFTVPANTTIYAAADCTYDASVGVTGDVTDESDNCDTSLEATFSDSVAAGSCEGEQVITRTWSLTDDCGNTTSKVQTITVEDNTAPDFTVPANTTIYAAADCTYDASVGVTGDVTDESDNCDTSLEATFSDSVAAGSCEGEQVITRTWSLTDDCGNTTSKVQTITVEDNTAPDFTVPANTTIYAAADCTYDASVGVTGDVTDESDNCDTSLEATFSDSVAAGSCEGEQVITRTWSLTDDCGNTTSKVQTITVEDNTAPDFTVPANTTIYAAADCTYDASVGVTGDVTDESDNCDTSLEATFSDSVAAGSCEGEQVITRTWSLTDDCGNTTSKVQTITVEDNTAPDFTVPANTTIYAAADCTYDASVGVTGDVTDESDNCDTSLEATFSDSVAAGSCEGEQVITRTWSLTDDCGNTTSKVQTITVEDNTAPDFTVPANTTIYAAADCTYDASVGVTGDVTDESDNCDTSLEATFSDSVAAGSCEGEQVITRTWSLTDDCGNTTSKVQTITVEDNTAPDFTVPANTTIYAAADCTYDASVGVTGDVTDESDNCDTSLEATFSDSVAAGSCEGEQVITRTWSLTDDCGNTTSKVQTITVEDNTAPDFTVPANTTIYAAADCTYDASVGVTGDVTDESDNCDTSLEATFSDSVAAGSCEGEQVITRTWSLTDDCGNTTSKVQTITVEDNTAPDFTVPANTTIYAAADCTYDASVGVTGDVTDESDNCDTSLEATFSDSVAAGSCEGEQVITRTWSLTDDCGNTTSKVQTITVEDNTAPDFTVPANTTIYAAADCTYDASVGVTGDVTDESDNCDTSLEATFSDSVAEGSCEGEQVITRTWSLTDDCGNTTSKVQTITVEDNTAPIIDETNKANIDIECGVGNTTQTLQDWLDNNAGATATDNCSSVVWTNDYGNDTSIKCDGSYINVTFTATDACGNQSSVVAGYLIKDDTAPVIATEASSSTVECDGSGNLSELNTWLSSNGGASATDACSVVSWSNNFTELDYTCSFVGEVEVIFTATDACGNTSTSTAKFTIEDTKAPEFVESLPGDITVSCDNIPVMEVLTATDDCDTTVTVVPSEVTSGDDDACGSEYLITRKWTVSDCSGNTTTHIQSITVEDTKAPEFVESLPGDITVSCDNIPAMEVLTATDNCDAVVTVVPSEVTSGDDDACGSEYLITRKWTVSDCSGNTTTHIQSITVEDTKAPEFVESLPGDITVSCDNIPAMEVLTATDNCDTTVTVVPSEVTSGDDDACGSEYLITRKWTVSDCSGNTTTHIQSITVEDTKAPEFVESLPGDITVSCDNIPAMEVLTATDNCDAVVTVVPSEVTSGDDDACGSEYLITRKWTVSDCSGNTTTHIQSITVEDTKAPEFVESLPGDITVSCDNIPAMEVLTATDNCDAVVTVVPSEVTSGDDDACGSEYLITRKWTVSDCSGNTTTHTQTIEVEDTKAPEFVESLPENTTVSCDAIPEAAILTATDNCDSEVTVNYSEAITGQDDECASVYTITRTWTVSDCANNTTTHTQTIEVEDTKAPEFVESLPENTTVSCDAIPEAVILTATDNCDSEVTVNYSEAITGQDDECASVYTITRTWTVSDCANNTTTHTQTIEVEDTKAPEFVESLPENTTVSCDAIPEAVILTATDNCDSEVTVNYSEAITGQDDECASVYTITRTWTVSDCANNTTTHTQTIEVEDTKAPEFVESLPENTTVSCDAIPEAVILTATDNCDSEVTVNYSETITGQDDECASVYTITRTWTVSDCANNTTTHTQTIEVEDTKAPEFVESLPENTTVSCDAIPEAVILTATDNCDSEVTVNYSETITGQDDECASVYTITRTWTVSDCANNTTTHTQTIEVEDTKAPEFVESLPENTTVSCDAIPEAEVLTATDNCDSEVTVNYSEAITGQDDECASVYTITRTWTVSDCANNTTTHTQTIEVEDTKAPEFVESLPENTTVSCDAIPEAEVLTATDNCDSEVTVNYSETITGQDDECASVYTITRTWTVSDCANNTTTHTQTIEVEDTKAPEFVESLPENTTVSCDAIPEAAILTATDNCDSEVTVNYSEAITGQDDECASVYTITRTWTVSDCASNTTTHTQTIEVEDTKAPEFVESLPADTTVSCDTIPEAVILTATDNCDSEVTVNYSEVITGQDDECASVYTITRTWTVSDCANNTTTHTQTIEVEDTKAPEFVESLPGDITVSCDNIPAMEVLTATDNCDTVVTVNYSEAITGQDDECASVYTITRTWTVSDCANNTTTHTQTIEVEDTKAPEFVESLPENTTVSCDDIPEAEVLTATDNCDSEVTVNYSEAITGQDDECASVYTITRTWTVSDCANNSTTHTQTIEVEDTKAPEFVESLPENTTVSCDAIPEAVILTATDNCDSEVTVNYSEVITGQDDECASVYTITRTWTVSDCANNTTTHTQTIEVEDTKAPEFVESLPADTTVSCDAIPEAEVLTATDNCDSEVTVNYSETITGQGEGCPSEYTIIRVWESEDCAGNKVSHTQEIKVEDNEAPELVTNLTDINVSCDEIPEVPTLEFVDNCSSNVTQTNFEEENTFDGTNNDYQIIRTWTVADDCGNTAEFVQNINVTIETVTTTIADSKCIDDGIVDLNDYLINISTDGEWEVTSGNVTLTTDNTFDPSNIALGDYVFTYTVANEGCLSSISLTININDDCVVLPCGQEDVIISKAVTPNGDTWNEFFTVTGIESCGFITNVKIFNRWGARVYESNNYANDWNGISDGSTFGSAKRLPAGTYYYIVVLENSGLKPFTGAIYLGTK